MYLVLGITGQLDEYAVPTVLVTGSAKAGTTYLYALLRTFDDFHSKDRKQRHTVLEKEFNIASRAQRYVSAPDYLMPCPAETLANLMRCPAHVARRSKGTHYVDTNTRCLHWLTQAKAGTSGMSKNFNFIKPFELPKYVVDANPLLATFAEADMPVLLKVNRRNEMCLHSTKKDRQPFMIMSLRRPLSRLESFYTHFVVRRQAARSNKNGEEEDEEEKDDDNDDDGYEVLKNGAPGRVKRGKMKTFGWDSLEREAHRELACLAKDKDKVYLSLSKEAVSFASTLMSSHGSLSFDFAATYEGARAVVTLYEKAKQTLQRCLGRRGLLLDGLYLPQLLSLVYPESKERERQSDRAFAWPLLVINSEVMFTETPSSFRSTLWTHLYPHKAKEGPPRFEESLGLDEDQKSLLLRFKAFGVDSYAAAGESKSKNKHAMLFENGTKTGAQMARMTEKTIMTIQALYAPYNAALYKTLDWLQSTKRISAIAGNLSRFDEARF